MAVPRAPLHTALVTEAGVAAVEWNRYFEELTLEVERLTRELAAQRDATDAAASAPVTPVVRPWKAGDIKMVATADSEEGWGECDGGESSRLDDADLFAAIGTIFGEGDGITTFNRPNLSEVFPIGIGDNIALGDTGGAASVTLSAADIPRLMGTAGAAGGHFHGAGTLVAAAGGAHSHGAGALVAAEAAAHSHGAGTLAAGSAGAHTHPISGTAGSAGSHTHTYEDRQRDIIRDNRVGATSSRASTTDSSLTRTTSRSGSHSHTVSGTAGSAGSHTHTITGTTDSAGSHTHIISGSTDSAGSHSHTISGSTTAAPAHTHPVTVGSAAPTAHENRPPYLGVRFLIKL